MSIIPTITIRASIDTDIDVLTALRQAQIVSTIGDATYEVLASTAETESGVLLVGTIAATVLGFGAIQIDPQRHHVGLLDVVVDNGPMSRMVGSRLLAELLHCADSSLHLLRLETLVVSDDHYLSLWTEYGFAIEARHRDFVRRGKGYADAYTLARINPLRL